MWQKDTKQANAAGKNGADRLFNAGLPQTFDL